MKKDFYNRLIKMAKMYRLFLGTYFLEKYIENDQESRDIQHQYIIESFISTLKSLKLLLILFSAKNKQTNKQTVLKMHYES